MQAAKQKPYPHTNSEAAADVIAAEASSTAETMIDGEVDKQSVNKKTDSGLRGPFDYLFANVATAALWAVIGLILFRLFA